MLFVLATVGGKLGRITGFRGPRQSAAA